MASRKISDSTPDPRKNKNTNTTDPPPPCPDASSSSSSWASDLRGRLTRPWMIRWAEAAAAPATAADACKAAGVPFGDFVAARRDDPAFRALCRLHDEVIDFRISDSLRGQAMDGEVRAQSLYYHRVRAVVLDDQHATHGPALSGERAEAMVLALLRADGALPAVDTSPPPPSSRPGAGLCPQSGDGTSVSRQ